jgi:hypothetical protein
MVGGRVVVLGRGTVARIKGRADRRQLGGAGRRGWAVVLMGRQVGVMRRQRRGAMCLRGRLGPVSLLCLFPLVHSLSLVVDRAPRNGIAEHHTATRLRLRLRTRRSQAAEAAAGGLFHACRRRARL